MTAHESEPRLAPFLYFNNLPLWHAEPPRARVAVSSWAPAVVARSRRQPRRRPWLMVVVMMLGLGGAAASWHGTLPAKEPQPPQRLGIDLRTEPPTPKFNSSSAEPPPMPVLPHVAEVQVPPHPVETMPTPMPAAPHKCRKCRRCRTATCRFTPGGANAADACTSALCGNAGAAAPRGGSAAASD